jgi:hypothetical protein
MAVETMLETRKNAKMAKQFKFLKSEGDWENKMVVCSFGESGGMMDLLPHDRVCHTC